MIRMNCCETFNQPLFCMQTSKFQLFRSQDHHIYFRLKNRLNETILVSQPYFTKAAALIGISDVMNSGRTDCLFSRRLSSSYKYYYVLKNRQGRILGASEMFETKNDRENSIQLLRNSIDVANVQDLA